MSLVQTNFTTQDSVTYKTTIDADIAWLITFCANAFYSGGSVIPIASGGTGQTTAQSAINALSAVSAASAGNVLTKVGSNAAWTAPTSSPLTIKRLANQFDKTNTNLDDVTELSQTVLAGQTYHFRAQLFLTAVPFGGNGGGYYFSLGGTCTATSIRFNIDIVDINNNVFILTSRLTSLGSPIGVNTGSSTAYAEAFIEGTIVVNAGGTLVPRFAQNFDAGTSSILTNSYFKIEQ